MTIKETNFEQIQGDKWDTYIVLTDQNGLVDFTGYTFQMQVRDKEGGSNLCATASLDDGITVTGLGTIYVKLTGAKTAKFNTPKSKYQIVSINPSGDKETLIQGWFDVTPNVVA